jgi:hypothetical protein
LKGTNPEKHTQETKKGRGVENIPLFCNNNPKNKECGKLEFSTLSTGFQQQDRQVAQRNSSK